MANSNIDRFLQSEEVTLKNIQRQALECMLTDMSNPEIEKHLNLTKRGLDNRRHRIYKAFGVNSREQVMARYIEFLEGEEK